MACRRVDIIEGVHHVEATAPEASTHAVGVDLPQGHMATLVCQDNVSGRSEAG